MLTVPAALPNFAAPAHVIDAPGATAALRGLDATAVVVVARSEYAAAAVMSRLRAPRIEHVRPSWAGEPTLEGLRGTSAALELIRPDWIVAVGGGSVIDGAKLAWVRYEHPQQTFVPRQGLVPISRLRSRSRFIAIPTTAGSGSEMSSAAVFVTSTGSKCACISPELMPDAAVLDARLLTDVPRNAIASSAMDALAHAVEGFTSRVRNPFVDAMALHSAGAIVTHVRRVVADAADCEAAQALLRAASHAGLVQNHRLPGLGHAIAHQLARAGIPHSTANAVLLPTIIRCNSADPSVAAEYAQLARACGFGTSATELADGIVALREALRLPGNLTDAAATPIDRSATIAGALADACVRGNPVPMTEALIDLALDLAWK